MRRRDFLYNASLLFPAVLLSPALALASQKTLNAAMLVIQDAAAVPDHLASVYREMPVQVHQLPGRQISQLTYSENGFVVTTSDNRTILAQKMVVHTMHRLNSPLSRVEITTGGKTFHLEYFSTNENTVVPECWFLKGKQLNVDKTMSFMNRKRHAVLCLSDL